MSKYLPLLVAAMLLVAISAAPSSYAFQTSFNGPATYTSGSLMILVALAIGGLLFLGIQHVWRTTWYTQKPLTN